MIKARLQSGKLIGISFSHILKDADKQLKKNELPWTHETTCYVHEVDGVAGTWKEMLGMGQSRCSPSDTFNKEKGRKIALVRALDDAAFNRSDRGAVWDAYFGRFQEPTKTEGVNG